MNDLKIEIATRDKAAIISLIGSAGMHDADHMNMLFTRVLATRPSLAVLDLSQLSLIASVAMGAIIALKGGLKVQGGVVKLAAAQKNVADSLRRARIDQVIPMCETVEEALGG